MGIRGRGEDAKDVFFLRVVVLKRAHVFPKKKGKNRRRHHSFCENDALLSRLGVLFCKFRDSN